MDLISVFHMDVEWFGIYGPVENGLDMDYNFNPSGPTGDRRILKWIRNGIAKYIIHMGYRTVLDQFSNPSGPTACGC